MTPQDTRTLRSLTPLSQGVELVVQIVKQLATNDLASTLNGESLNAQEVKRMAAARIRQKLS